MSNNYIETRDGTKLFYSTEGKGKPLLFLYGLVCSINHWKYQIEHYKKDHQIIWFDYRGHHKSELPNNISSLTVETMAEDANLILDHLGVKKVDVLGHSIGVSVALALSNLAPEKVKSNVLMNGCARGPLETLMKTNLTQHVHSVMAKLYTISPSLMNIFWASQANSKFVYWLISHFGFNPNLAKSEDIQEYIRAFSQLDMAVFIELLKNYDRYDATPWLHYMKIPTLIIGGDNDWVTPKEAQELMHQLIPSSELILIKNGSHCPQLDTPEYINGIIDQYYAKLYS